MQANEQALQDVVTTVQQFLRDNSGKGRQLVAIGEVQDLALDLQTIALKAMGKEMEPV